MYLSWVNKGLLRGGFPNKILCFLYFLGPFNPPRRVPLIPRGGDYQGGFCVFSFAQGTLTLLYQLLKYPSPPPQKKALAIINCKKVKAGVKQLNFNTPNAKGNAQVIAYSHDKVVEALENGQMSKETFYEHLPNTIPLFFWCAFKCFLALTS